jgi:hypothetical protein
MHQVVLNKTKTKMFLLIEFAIYFSVVHTVISIALSTPTFFFRYFSEENDRKKDSDHWIMNFCATLVSIYYIHKYI